MTKGTNNALVSALQDFIRVVLIAILPIVIAQLEVGNQINWASVYTAAIIAILKALDTYLHKTNVDTPLDLKQLDTLRK